MIRLDRSALIHNNGLPFIEVPQLASLQWIRHAFLTRKGGRSPSPFHSLNLSTATGDTEDHTRENRKAVAAGFGFDPKQLVLLHQRHRDEALILKDMPTSLSPLEYDAVITNVPNRFLGIKTADCLPLLVVDPVRKVIAAIHAGREGTALRITRSVLKKMRSEFNCSPADLIVAMGPSIGPCCYEIDVRVFHSELEQGALPTAPGRWRLDLPRINREHLKAEGVREDQIFWVDLCTACNTDLFFSHRRERITGRQLSFIGITG